MSKTLFKGTKGKWIYRVTSWTNRIPSSITISQEHTDPVLQVNNFQIVEVLQDYNLFVDRDFDRFNVIETIANAKLIANAPVLKRTHN
jgi:hypothetical protein